MRGAVVAICLLFARADLPSQVVCAPDSTRKVSGALALFASIPEETAEAAEVRRARGGVLQEYVRLFEQPKDVTRLQAKAERIVRQAGSVFEPGLLAIGELRFTVSARGHTSNGTLAKPTSDPGLDSALLRGMARMDSAHVSFFTAGGRDTLQMRIDIGFNPSAGLYPMLLVRLAPLGTITRSAHILPTDVQPSVPMSYWAKHIDDEIVVRVLVDARGRAVMDSVRVVQGKDQVYIDAILAAIPKYRWSPAQAGDCTVKQWVQMPFTFHFAPTK